jgi:NAD-dependent deacetylase
MIADRVHTKILTRFLNAQKICVLTGLDLASQTGVPPFYGHKALAWQGQRIDDLLSRSNFRQNVSSVWQWLEHRRVLVSHLNPSLAYYALAHWENIFTNFTLITETVDGLHIRAGNKNTLEIQGSLWKGYCEECLEFVDLSEPKFNLMPPRCLSCHSILLPGINFSDERLELKHSKETVLAVANCDLLIVIGIQSTFLPAANLLMLANRNHVSIIEVAKSETDLTPICEFTLIGNLDNLLSQFIPSEFI